MLYIYVWDDCEQEKFPTIYVFAVLEMRACEEHTHTHIYICIYILMNIYIYSHDKNYIYTHHESMWGAVNTQTT